MRRKCNKVKTTENIQDNNDITEERRRKRIKDKMITTKRRNKMYKLQQDTTGLKWHKKTQPDATKNATSG